MWFILSVPFLLINLIALKDLFSQELNVIFTNILFTYVKIITLFWSSILKSSSVFALKNAALSLFLLKPLLSFSSCFCKSLRHDSCFSLWLTDMVNCRGMALDWLSRNLYWLSSENDESQINVARFDGSLKTSIIHGIDKPRNLVVHPARG